MAEALLRYHLQKRYPDSDWQISSAGTWTQDGFPATPFGIQVMAEKGLDTSQHRSRAISQDLLENYFLILTMESGHKEALQIEFPHLADRVFMLSEMSGKQTDIEDPVGKPISAYRETANEIEEWIVKGIPKILEYLQQ